MKIYEILAMDKNEEIIAEYDTENYPIVGGTFWKLENHVKSEGQILKVYDDRIDDKGNETGVITIIIDMSK